MAKGEFKMIPTSDLVTPQQMTMDEARLVAGFRLRDNLQETGHPFHHMTANGVIVDTDPTLEYMLSRLEQTERDVARTAWMKMIRPDAPKAIPVNRTFYGVDPYERH